MKRNDKDNWLRLGRRQESFHEDKLSLKYAAFPSGMKLRTSHAPLSASGGSRCRITPEHPSREQIRRPPPPTAGAARSDPSALIGGGGGVRGEELGRERKQRRERKESRPTLKLSSL